MTGRRNNSDRTSVLGKPTCGCCRHSDETTGSCHRGDHPMIRIRRSDERGHADHGWLDARHTFSFARYYDPRFLQFGPLRVLNQDRVQPSRGFDTHGHKDMEIVTYVLEGALEHKDSMGNGSQILPGDVQLMSAGTGVTHSEYNASDVEPLHLLQMWVQPRELGTPPRYAQALIPEAARRGKLCLAVSQDAPETNRDAHPLRIGQDATLYVSLLGPGDRTTLDLGPERAAWLHVARGQITINGETLAAGDGAGVVDEPQITLHGSQDAKDGDADLVLWEVAADEDMRRA